MSCMDDTSKQEILEAINAFATDVQHQFDGLKTDVNGLKNDVAVLKADMAQIKATMVTRDYPDEKKADLRGDMVVLTRKEDKKVVAIIELLVERNVIEVADAKRILGMEPFPQLS